MHRHRAVNVAGSAAATARGVVLEVEVRCLVEMCRGCIEAVIREYRTESDTDVVGLSVTLGVTGREGGDQERRGVYLV